MRSMSFREWLRNRGLILGIGLTVPAIAAAGVGWQVRQRESRLAVGRVEREAKESAASALEAAVSATEQILRDPEAMRFAAVTPDSVAVTFNDTRLEALPHGRLLYYPLASSGSVFVGSPLGPAELLERSARCGLLADQRRTTELKGEALELRERLLDGRWRVTRSVFEAYLHAASEWAQAGEPPSIYRQALSAAVARLWYSRVPNAQPEDASPGGWVGRRFTMTVEGVPLTFLVQTNGTRTNALVAGPGYVQQEWRAKTVRLGRLSGEAGRRGEPQ